MSNPSPLIPQGTFLGQPGKSHIRIAVFTILAIHVVLLGALLLQGCKRTDQAKNGGLDGTNEFSGWNEQFPAPPPPLERATNASPTLPNTVSAAPPPPGTSPGTSPGTPPSTPPPPPPSGTTTSILPPAPLPPGGRVPPTNLHVRTPPTTTAPPIESPPTPSRPIIADPTTTPPAITNTNEIYTPSTPPPGAVGTGTEYVIMRGDSFSLLARKFGVSVREIAAANRNVDPRRLQIGQKIFIPASTAVAAAPSEGTTGAASSDKVHVVVSGDSLYSISRRYKTTVKKLRARNNLRTDRILVGQKLFIPSETN